MIQSGGSLVRLLRQVRFPLIKIILTLFAITVLIPLGLASVHHQGSHSS